MQIKYAYKIMPRRLISYERKVYVNKTVESFHHQMKSYIFTDYYTIQMFDLFDCHIKLPVMISIPYPFMANMIKNNLCSR